MRRSMRRRSQHSRPVWARRRRGRWGNRCTAELVIAAENGGDVDARERAAQRVVRPNAVGVERCEHDEAGWRGRRTLKLVVAADLV